jgi:CRISPR-associated protein Cas1
MSTRSDPIEDVPDLIPSRILNEFAYCPRLAYLEWVQAEWEANEFTADGAFQHRRVDQEEGKLPEAKTADPRPQTPDEQPDTIHAQSVWLSAPNEGLTARIDLVEGEGNNVRPVDYKRGEVPDTPERSWLPDRIQLCAQALILRENGYRCESGVIYYVASKTRIEIAIDDDLVRTTRGLAAELRQLGASAPIPPPLVDSPKCVGCSLAGICLPDETNFLGQDTQPGSMDEDGLRRILPPRDDALPLYVQEQGAYLSKRGELFEVRKKGQKVAEARIFETPQVSIFGNVEISTPALREMLFRGIPVCYFSTGGWFYGMAHGLGHKNIELRQRQYAAAQDPHLALGLANAFIAAKITNCRTLLKRNHPELPGAVADELAQLAEKAQAASCPASLLGIEGAAARLYFQHFAGMLKAHRAPTDQAALTETESPQPESLPPSPGPPTKAPRQPVFVFPFEGLLDDEDNGPGSPQNSKGSIPAPPPPSAANAPLGSQASQTAPGIPAPAPPPPVSAPSSHSPSHHPKPEDPGFDFHFEGRNRRPPLDPVNSMLSYAYSLLAKDLTVVAMSVGFDPYLGFYHQPRYGRPALALDLMEEFRPIIADSVVLWAINNRVVKASDFIRRGTACAFKPEARKKFIVAYETRMDALVTHPIFGYRISYSRILQVQVRLLARVLLGEIPEYPAFKTR